MAAKSKVYKKYTPELLALYLIDIDPKLAIPDLVTAEKILEKCPDIGLSLKRIDVLREDPEFVATVKREFVDRVKDKEHLERLFFVYFNHYIAACMKAANPSPKPLEILGYMTGQYNPKKPDPPKKELTAGQRARMLHNQEQAEAERKKREGGGDATG